MTSTLREPRTDPPSRPPVPDASPSPDLRDGGGHITLHRVPQTVDGVTLYDLSAGTSG